MYYTECERLAERHPDLAEAAAKIDGALSQMESPDVIRADDLASFLGLDPNQISAVLSGLVRASVLRAEEMVECPEPDCGIAVLRSDYEETLKEDGEYRCTSCDRPWQDPKLRAITTYRRGENWREVSNPTDGSVDTDLKGTASASTPPHLGLDEQAWYTHDRLAEIFNVGKDALRKRLARYREHNLNGWKENEDRRPREPKHLYRLKDVRHIIEELRASSERPAK